ncbi:MAG: hypothetical protein U9P10_04245 [Thermodesulfobacteriota bacterium]|nr:hypothetical protein [Thermodesulfobacteriota bacterium]
MTEISDYASRAGFTIQERSFENYFDYQYLDHANGRLSRKRRYRLVNLAYTLLPPPLRPGLCLVLSGRTEVTDCALSGSDRDN